MNNQKKTPRAADVHVGQRLRLARLERGLSQEKLGDTVGLTFQQIQKYEKGSNRIGASRLWELCGILDVEPGYFFDGLTRHGITGKAVAPMIDPRALQLALRFTKLPEAIRKNAVKLIEVIEDQLSSRKGAAE